MSKYQPVIDSYVRCIEDDQFLDRFYRCFLESDNHVKHMFQYVDFDKQKDLLRKGLMSMITYFQSENIGGKVTLRRLKETHGKTDMDIKHHHFMLWKTCLLQTITETDNDISSEYYQLWEEVIDRGIEMIAAQGSHARFHR